MTDTPKLRRSDRRVNLVTGELRTHYLDQDGRELVSDRPVEAAIGYKPQPSLAEQIRQMIRSEKLQAAYQDAESFEEADDFDIDDDEVDPSTPYERDFDGLSVAELKARHLEAGKALQDAETRLVKEAAGEPPDTNEDTSNQGQ